MIDYNKLGKYIDNIYTGATENSSRKIVTKLQGNTLTLNFRSIVNIGRNERNTDLDKRKRELEKEAIQLIKAKKQEIQKSYNAESDVKLKIKEAKDANKINTLELITFSPISPVRTYKFSYCICFELS